VVQQLQQQYPSLRQMLALVVAEGQRYGWPHISISDVVGCVGPVGVTVAMDDGVSALLAAPQLQAPQQLLLLLVRQELVEALSSTMGAAAKKAAAGLAPADARSRPPEHIARPTAAIANFVMLYGSIVRGSHASSKAAWRLVRQQASKPGFWDPLVEALTAAAAPLGPSNSSSRGGSSSSSSNTGASAAATLAHHHPTAHAYGWACAALRKALQGTRLMPSMPEAVQAAMKQLYCLVQADGAHLVSLSDALNAASTMEV
jgi:hypothetical protein